MSKINLETKYTHDCIILHYYAVSILKKKDENHSVSCNTWPTV